MTRYALGLALFVGMTQVLAQPTWIGDGRPTRQALEMMTVLRNARQFGLPAENYAIALTSDELQRVTSGQAGAPLPERFDAALSEAARKFLLHLHSGRVDAAQADFHLPAASPLFDAGSALRQLATASGFSATLASLEPQAPPYRNLKAALARYQELAQRTELTALPPLPNRSLEVGDTYEGAEHLRMLLHAFGDLEDAATGEPANTIDPPLRDAVQRFQTRHGLTPDGVIGRRTFAALTTPLAQRVRQIELSLERWRWFSALPRPDIVVNIPQFMLYALPSRPDAKPLEMPVIVGEGRTRTPVFTATIEQVVFQPYWDVPASILHKELLPKIRKNASYLERNHFEIVAGASDNARVVEPTASAIEALAAGRFRLRQRPGADNALGPVKFVLPNPYGVRMHGTPEEDLFTRSVRAFSHGCVRVGDPAALAQYVLQNAPDAWSASRVEEALCGTQTLRVKLAKPVSVVFFYATATATRSLGVMFAADLYGYDRRLERLLGLRPVANAE